MDCAGDVEVVAYIVFGVHLYYGIYSIVIPMMYTKDSYSKWFYTWLAKF